MRFLEIERLEEKLTDRARRFSSRPCRSRDRGAVDGAPVGANSRRRGAICERSRLPKRDFFGDRQFSRHFRGLLVTPKETALRHTTRARLDARREFSRTRHEHLRAHRPRRLARARIARVPRTPARSPRHLVYPVPRRFARLCSTPVRPAPVLVSLELRRKRDALPRGARRRRFLPRATSDGPSGRRGDVRGRGACRGPPRPIDV